MQFQTANLAPQMPILPLDIASFELKLFGN